MIDQHTAQMSYLVNNGSTLLADIPYHEETYDDYTTEDVEQQQQQQQEGGEELGTGLDMQTEQVLGWKSVLEGTLLPAIGSVGIVGREIL